MTTALPTRGPEALPAQTMLERPSIGVWLAETRFATLRWGAGMYFLVLGMSLLLLPQNSLASLLGPAWLRGGLSAAGGLALLWLAALRPRRPTAVIVSSLVVLPQLIYATEFAALGTWVAAVLFLFCLGILVAAFITPRPAPVARRPVALGIVLGLSQMASGLDFMTRPAAAGTIPPQLGLSPGVVGWVYVLVGGALVVSHLLPGVPRPLYIAAHLVAGGMVLGLWVAVAVWLDPIYWLQPTAVILRGVMTLILPWWSERVALLDGRSVQVRLALTLITVALIALLVTPPLILDQVERELIAHSSAQLSNPAGRQELLANLTRVRQVTFSIALLTTVIAGAVGWGLAKVLTRPLARLVAGVNRIAAGERQVALLRAGPTELVTLSGAVETMTAALDAREQERQRLFDAREDYIRAISHDLRNPLTSVSGNAQLLERALAREGTAREERLARAIVRGSGRLNNMIQDLVDSLRLEAGGVSLNLLRLDLTPLAQEACERAGDPEQTARIVVIPPPDGPVWVMADPERVERVIVNLLSNALKYAPAPTPVTLRIERQGEQVVVAVTDEGPGLTAEEQAGLFQPYSRVERTRAGSPGLGLGLYISRSLVEAHGGRIWVESAPEQGATFRFSLPAAT